MKTAKRFLSIILALSVLASVFAFGSIDAFAAIKYSEQKQQYNTQQANFNFIGGDLYYSYTGAKNSIRKISKLSDKGSKVKTVDYVDNIAVSKDYIFWNDYTAACVYRCKKNGKSKKAVITYKSSESLNYIVSGKRLIYHVLKFDKNWNVKSNTIYVSKLNGKDAKKIVKDARFYTLFTYKDKLYFVKNSYICSYDFNSGKTEKLKKADKTAFLSNMEGSTLYYSKYKDIDETTTKYTVYKLNVNTKKSTMLREFTPDEPTYSILPTGGKVYILTGTGAGCAFAEVKKSKIDYKSYYSNYELGGDCIGFYKNSIIMENYSAAADGELRRQGFVKMIKL